MKKILALALCACMVLAMAACGAKTETPATTEAPTTEAATTEAPTTEETASQEELDKAAADHVTTCTCAEGAVGEYLYSLIGRAEGREV